MTKIPKDAKNRIVDGMPVISIGDEESALLACEVISDQILEGDWLVEFGNVGRADKYMMLCMNDICEIESAVEEIQQYVDDRYYEDDTDWWIGIIPLKDWSHTFGDMRRAKELEPPDKLEVYTYEYTDEDGNTFVPNQVLNWTTPEQLCKRLVNMGRLGDINIVSRYILRKDLEARPTMPFVSDFVREAFNIAPYRYWKGKQNG